MTEPTTAVLEGKGLRVSRGGVSVLDVPSVSITEGEVLALIGPNGAGKTTLLQTLSYLLKPASGELYFRGAKVGSDVSGPGVSETACHGVSGAASF